jgi:glutamine synthetase
MAKMILFRNSYEVYNLQFDAGPSLHFSPLSPGGDLVLASRDDGGTGSSLLADFLFKHPELEFVWLQYLSYTSSMRLRMTPVSEFKKLVGAKKWPGITMGLMYLLEGDAVIPGGSATGQFYLEPDLSSLCMNVGLPSKSASVMTFWRQENGDELGGCPRTTLKKVADIASNEHEIQLLLGFEIEVVFFKLSRNAEGEASFSAWHSNHSWSSMTTQQIDALPMLESMVKALAEAGIHILQFHAESAPGQWEFVLPPLPPLRAVDSLYKARQILSYVARAHGLHATLYPRPFPHSCGNAAHVHFSLAPARHENSFLAGVLEHLPAVCALSLCQEASYERVAPGIWSGGEWVAWGTQNRETPLRKIDAGHFELKMVDGLANMYFAAAALLGAGLWGVSTEQQLRMRDCPRESARHGFPGSC